MSAWRDLLAGILQPETRKSGFLNSTNYENATRSSGKQNSKQNVSRYPQPPKQKPRFKASHIY